MSGKEFSNRNRLKFMVCDFLSTHFLLGGPLNIFADYKRNVIWFFAKVVSFHSGLVHSVILADQRGSSQLPSQTPDRTTNFLAPSFWNLKVQGKMPFKGL